MSAQSDAGLQVDRAVILVPVRASPQPSALAAGAILALALGAATLALDGRMLALFALGLLLGATLVHASFGFASAYRRWFETRDARGLRAQLVMLAVASVLFAPVLAEGEVFGRGVTGAFAPVGVSVAIGAFLFGIGMQLAGGCGSGTLFAAGSGHGRMLVTLAAFCAGSFWASLDMDWWQRQPAFGEVVLGSAFGWPLAVALQLGVLTFLWWLLRGHGPSAEAPPFLDLGWRRFLQGPWPLTAGACLLAVLNFATLALAGHPWSITWAFTLWGAKGAQILGWDAAGAPFWGGEFQRSALEASVFADTTSVMDFGIFAGAFLAAALAGRYALRLRHPPGALAAAVIGGLAMGYGARIAYGCNIGAFFSGIASTSLHGWLWIVAALPGCWLGLRLRSRFGLD